jgi:hypothetical protein
MRYNHLSCSQERVVMMSLVNVFLSNLYLEGVSWMKVTAQRASKGHSFRGRDLRVVFRIEIKSATKGVRAADITGFFFSTNRFDPILFLDQRNTPCDPAEILREMQDDVVERPIPA